MFRWFLRHLNWTTLVLTISANVISHYLVFLLLYLTKIPYGGPLSNPGITATNTPAFTSFGFDAQLLLADILLVVSFSWVLRKKNRNWKYLLLFISFFVFDLPVFLSYIISFSLPVILLFLRAFSVLLWVTGWIILLKLKNKPIMVTNELRDEQ
jgi:hypothetical protein